MTREEAVAKLMDLLKSDDIETQHIEADGILCNLLSDLGYIDVVDAWCKVPKWYA